MAEELASFIERGSDARGAVGDRAIARTCPALTSGMTVSPTDICTEVEPDLSAFFPDLRPNDERTALDQRLDYYRRAVISKIENLDDAQASTRVLPATDLTVGGIVKHLAWVEDHWFQARLLGVDLPEPWASAPLTQDRNWPFHSAQHDSVEDLIDLYSTASLGKGPINLRWILVHMIDETACHTGHLDLLRDGIDLRAPA